MGGGTGGVFYELRVNGSSVGRRGIREPQDGSSPLPSDDQMGGLKQSNGDRKNLSHRFCRTPKKTNLSNSVAYLRP